jgi:hypothetical protein
MARQLLSFAAAAEPNGPVTVWPQQQWPNTHD